MTAEQHFDMKYVARHNQNNEFLRNVQFRYHQMKWTGLKFQSNLKSNGTSKTASM